MNILTHKEISQEAICQRPNTARFCFHDSIATNVPENLAWNAPVRVCFLYSTGIAYPKVHREHVYSSLSTALWARGEKKTE